MYQYYVYLYVYIYIYMYIYIHTYIHTYMLRCTVNPTHTRHHGEARMTQPLLLFPAWWLFTFWVGATLVPTGPVLGVDCPFLLLCI